MNSIFLDFLFVSTERYETISEMKKRNHRDKQNIEKVNKMK